MITTKRTAPDNPEFQELVRLLNQELWKRYEQEMEFYDAFNKLDSSMKVIIAMANAEAIGCGALRPMEEDGVIEVKRMYVKPEWRGVGVAKVILKELEKWAGEENYKILRLETGQKQPEAIALYLRCGYYHIENYGPYKNIPESVCMEKVIG